MDLGTVTPLVYLLSAVLFIFGIKRLGHPETAAKGNRLASVGMLLAILATLLDRQILDFTWIIAGLVAGGLIGLVMAKTIKMTAMPEMVAVFNGFGGAASGLVATGEYLRIMDMGGTLAIDAGGSTISDFVNVEGDLGYFSHSFQVYGREGEACVVEGCNSTIRRIVQSGRSTFYCPKCQH